MKVWTAVDRNRLKFVDFEVGAGNVYTFKKLWNRVKNNVIGCICTDGYRVYKDELPVNIPHVVSKAETCLVESKNWVLRYYLERLRRKTKGYSKSNEMLKLSINLLLNKNIVLSRY